jgi:DNA-binding IclR family transcriptional regulator
MTMPDSRHWTENRAGARELRRIFEARDGEWMTIQDAADHLGLPYKTARAYLAGLTGAGLLERVSVYKVKGQ